MKTQEACVLVLSYAPMNPAPAPALTLLLPINSIMVTGLLAPVDHGYYMTYQPWATYDICSTCILST